MTTVKYEVTIEFDGDPDTTYLGASIAYGVDMVIDAGELTKPDEDDVQLKSFSIRHVSICTE